MKIGNKFVADEYDDDPFCSIDDEIENGINQNTLGKMDAVLDCQSMMIDYGNAIFDLAPIYK